MAPCCAVHSAPRCICSRPCHSLFCCSIRRVLASAISWWKYCWSLSAREKYTFRSVRRWWPWELPSSSNSTPFAQWTSATARHYGKYEATAGTSEEELPLAWHCLDGNIDSALSTPSHKVRTLSAPFCFQMTPM
jgi:hypothetical protein